MQSISFCILILVINGGFTNARRVNKNAVHLDAAQQKVESDNAESGDHPVKALGQHNHSLAGASSQQHLDVFLDWTRDSDVPQFAEFMGPLVQGIIDNKKVEAITWTPPSAAFTEAGGLNNDHQGHLKIHLNVPKLYGEVSSQSRVPIAWTLEQEVTFTFHNTKDDKGQETHTAAVTGLGTLTSQQGFNLFVALANSKECADTPDCAPAKCEIDMSMPDMPACLKAEVTAADKYLSNNWKKGAKIKDQKGKVTEVLHTSYGKTAYYYAAKGNWGSIYYALISASNLEVTSFVVNADGKLYATSQARPTTVGAEYNRAQKSELMGAGQIRGNAAVIGIAIKAAKSGMNLAMLLAHGNDAIRPQLEELQLAAADASSIGSNLTPCEDSVELAKCKGNVKGRLHWTTDVPESMQ